VFSVAVLYPISLTPRFSKVHGRVYYTTALRFTRSLTKTAEAVGALLSVVNTS
jgi:hypothetical protein